MTTLQRIVFRRVEKILKKMDREGKIWSRILEKHESKINDHDRIRVKSLGAANTRSAD